MSNEILQDLECMIHKAFMYGDLHHGWLTLGFVNFIEECRSLQCDILENFDNNE